MNKTLESHSGSINRYASNVSTLWASIAAECHFASLDKWLWDWILRALLSSSTASPRSKTAAAPIPDPAEKI